MILAEDAGEEVRIVPYIEERAVLAKERIHPIDAFLQAESQGRQDDTLQPQIDVILMRGKKTGDSNMLLDLGGLGTNLAPCGDDVLVGVIVGLTASENVAHEAKAVLRGLRSAPREAARRTWR